MNVVTPHGANVTRRQVAAGFGWVALSNYSNRVLGLVSTLILAKVLTPADFGLVAIASMMLEVIQIFKDMGLSEAVIYQRREDRAALDTAHTMLVAYSAVLFLIAAAAAPLVAQFYDNPTILPVAVLMSSNLVVNSFRAVPLAVIRKNLENRKLVLPEVVPVTLSSLVSIAMALTGFGVWSLVAKSVLNSLLALLLLQWVMPFRPRFAFHRAEARELFQYGRFIVSTTLLLVLLYNVDRFFVSRVAGIAALGVFELAMRVAELPVKQFSFLVGAVMFPVFSRIEKTGPALRQVFLKTLKYTASITLPAAIGLSLFAPALMSQLYGPRWDGIGAPLRVLAIYAALRSLSSVIYDLFKATGYPSLMQRATLFKLGSVALLGIPAIRAFGVTGIAILLVITYSLALAWELRKLAVILEVPVCTILGVLTRPVALSATIIPVSYALLLGATSLSTPWELAAGILLAAGAYLSAMLWLDEEAVMDFKAFRASRRQPSSVATAESAVR
jgi:PST family polysaccharide transporter